jgi:hypothetical protein
MDDRLPGRRLAVVAVTGIVVILAGAAVSTAMVLVRPAPPPGGGQAPSAIGMVEQTPVEVQERGLAVERRARASLGAYGWADVDAGVAQLPIDRAMSRVVATYAAGDGGAR